MSESTKFVPREPTAEMVGAGFHHFKGAGWLNIDAINIWRAMYDAAPAASAAPLEEETLDIPIAQALRYADRNCKPGSVMEILATEVRRLSAPAVSAAPPDEVAALITKCEDASLWPSTATAWPMLLNEAAAMLRRLSEEKCDAITWVMWKQRAEAAEALAAQRGELLRAAEKDAARYRWLRQCARDDYGSCEIRFWWNCSLGKVDGIMPIDNAKVALDAAIDAALQSEGASHEGER